MFSKKSTKNYKIFNQFDIYFVNKCQIDLVFFVAFLENMNFEIDIEQEQ